MMMQREPDEVISVHGYPVEFYYDLDGEGIYICPLYDCHFRTSFQVSDQDVESRIRAYTEIHEHIKEHHCGRTS
ncbi:MAG: hypothetical protein ACE5JP_16760 [Candidatus Bipolaricaulia bacterium]